MDLRQGYLGRMKRVQRVFVFPEMRALDDRVLSFFQRSGLSLMKAAILAVFVLLAIATEAKVHSFSVSRTPAAEEPVPFLSLYKKYAHVEQMQSGRVSLRTAKAIQSAELQQKLAKPHLGAQGVTRLPLGGNVYPLGIYYINVGVGSNNAQFPVALDSG